MFINTRDAGQISNQGLLTCDNGFTGDECTQDRDIDDDCACDDGANTQDGCYDDCGICNVIGADNADYNGGIYTEDCVGNVAPPESCANSGTDLSSPVYMDCAGVCSNNYNGGTYGATIETYYADSDVDGWGDPAISEEFCTALLNDTDPAEAANYTLNNLDVDDDLHCIENYFDCSGACDGNAFEDNCGYCSEAWAGNGSIDNGNDLFEAVNAKYGVDHGIALATEPYDDSKVGFICECNDSATSIDDFDVLDCSYQCGGGATDYFYFYDNDADGIIGNNYGNLCSLIPEMRVKLAIKGF